ncbi:hypothetical protein VSH64_24765 [Amycolatopsis rhabdoformis]|uniref:Uncharacterized protein n=1 Tax=Amycolatopsis rhabdoformis TaxID=1448059 RepID=A0ABZ1HVI8_9PSEU|nr:hypothetical protein [Amycolatopsis rhabdoformis]WSE26090.1 hypothetical protein VSH64_24765 [Amycolatopsis rhabdoformis]
MPTDDGKRHVIYSKLTTAAGTIVKSMCGLWHTPAKPSANDEDCPKCAPYTLPTNTGR